jgi:hypothetical protein
MGLWAMGLMLPRRLLLHSYGVRLSIMIQVGPTGRVAVDE